MFRKLGSYLVTLYREDYAIKNDAHNLIFFGGLLGAGLAALVTKSPQILHQFHVSPIAPTLTRLNTLTPHPPSHLATTGLNPKHLHLPNLQRWGRQAGPKI